MTAFSNDFPVFDVSDEGFWAPENWPMLKAPIKVDVAYTGGGRYGVYLTLWMRLGRDWPAHVPPAKRGDDGLGSWSTSCTADGIDAAIAEGRKYLAAQRDLELNGGLAMATEELLELIA